MADAEQNKLDNQDKPDKSDKPDAKKRDEDPVGKVYDSRLVRRLGQYVRPYWVQATISALSISLKSLCDASGPYLDRKSVV